MHNGRRDRTCVRCARSCAMHVQTDIYIYKYRGISNRMRLLASLRSRRSANITSSWWIIRQYWLLATSLPPCLFTSIGVLECLQDKYVFGENSSKRTSVLASLFSNKNANIFLVFMKMQQRTQQFGQKLSDACYLQLLQLFFQFPHILYRRAPIMKLSLENWQILFIHSRNINPNWTYGF